MKNNLRSAVDVKYVLVVVLSVVVYLSVVVGRSVTSSLTVDNHQGVDWLKKLLMITDNRTSCSFTYSVVLTVDVGFHVGPA